MQTFTKTFGDRERRPGANMRLAQWRVKWLIEHSTSHQLLWCIDSCVLRNPPLRQAPNRCAQAAEKLTVDNWTVNNYKT